VVFATALVAYLVLSLCAKVALQRGEAAVEARAEALVEAREASRTQLESSTRVPCETAWNGLGGAEWAALLLWTEEDPSFRNATKPAVAELLDKKDWDEGELASAEAILEETRVPLLPLREWIGAGAPVANETSCREFFSLLLRMDPLLALEARYRRYRNDSADGIYDALLVRAYRQQHGPIPSYKGIATNWLEEPIDNMARSTRPGELDTDQIERLLELYPGACPCQRESLGLLMLLHEAEPEFTSWHCGPDGVGPNLLRSSLQLGGWRLALYEGPFARPLRALEWAEALRVSVRLSRIAPLPYHEAASRLEALESELRNSKRWQLSNRARFFSGDEFRPRHTFLLQAEQEAAHLLTRLGWRLEQYRARTGGYPQRLDAVAEYFGGQVPADPFTGGRFVYRPEEESFLLYSVGRNLADDGGKPSIREGDLVWREWQRELPMYRQ